MQNESEEYRSASAREPASGLPSSCGLAGDHSAEYLGDIVGGPSVPLPGAGSGDSALTSSPNRGLATGVLLKDGVLQNESEYSTVPPRPLVGSSSSAYTLSSEELAEGSGVESYSVPASEGSGVESYSVPASEGSSEAKSGSGASSSPAVSRTGSISPRGVVQASPTPAPSSLGGRPKIAIDSSPPDAV